MREGYFTEQGTPTDKAIKELNFFKLLEGLPIDTIKNMNLFVEYEGRKMLCLEYAYSVPDWLIKQDLETLDLHPHEIQEDGIPGMVSTIIYRYLCIDRSEVYQDMSEEVYTNYIPPSDVIDVEFTEE